MDMGQQQEQKCRADGVIGYASNVGQANCMKDESPRTVRTTVDVPASYQFSAALMALKDGQRVTRAGWNGPNQYVLMQVPDIRSKMTQPYLYLRNAQGELVPWVPSQGDLFANDWAILPGRP